MSLSENPKDIDGRNKWVLIFGRETKKSNTHAGHPNNVFSNLEEIQINLFRL
jgi:hypothetical protein